MAARYGDVFFLMQQQGETSHNFILGFLVLGSLPSRVILTRQSRLQRAILPCRGRLVPPPLEAGRVRARHAPEAAHAPAEGHAPAHAAPKHRRVDVVHVDAAHAAAAEAVVARAALVDLLQGPARVVLPPLLRVRQHRVGLAHQLELLLRLVPLLQAQPRAAAQPTRSSHDRADCVTTRFSLGLRWYGFEATVRVTGAGLKHFFLNGAPHRVERSVAGLCDMSILLHAMAWCPRVTKTYDMFAASSGPVIRELRVTMF